jgi:hypothetical protein
MILQIETLRENSMCELGNLQIEIFIHEIVHEQAPVRAKDKNQFLKHHFSSILYCFRFFLKLLNVIYK